MSESENALERDATDSDDGFEVVDPEPEEEPQDLQYLSRTSYAGNAGTIMFCHLNEEYKSIKEVKCEYIRPEGWSEKENDVVALFEVGWMNIDQAVAKFPVDLKMSQGNFPIGSVNLAEFAFCKEDYSECGAAVVSHFQFCYLRDGNVLGASTPFTIRGIGATRHLALLGEKPLFVPASLGQRGTAADAVISLYETTNNFSSLETASARTSHEETLSGGRATHDIADGPASVDLSALQSSVRNLTAMTKRLEIEDNRASKYTPDEILKLKESVDELTAEMLKAAGDLSSTQPPSSTASAAQLKANVQDCALIFDVCKVAGKNQTPPASLTEHEMSHFIRETEWKRQQEAEQLLKLQKAEEELKQLKEQMLSKETEQHKKLQKAEEEKQALKEVLALIEADCTELKQKLEKVGAELKGEVAIKEELERLFQKSNGLLAIAQGQLRMEEERRLEVQKSYDDLLKDFKVIQEELSLEDVGPRELRKQIQEKMSLNDTNMMSKLDAMQKGMREMAEELNLKEINHQNYVAEVEKQKKESEALAVAHASAKSQIESLQDEAKLYKSKLGETIVELSNSRQETDSLKQQCQKFVQDLNFMESEKERLMACISNLREELEKKEQGSSSVDAQHDVLVQEFLKKSDELNVAKQQIANFHDEVSRLTAQRTSLAEKLQEAQRKPASCERPCCSFEITPGRNQPESVVQSVLEALEQSHKENQHLGEELKTEKRRAQVLEDKLQHAAGQHRTLYMEKITLESRLKELLGSK